MKHTPGPWKASQPCMGFCNLTNSNGVLVMALAHPSSMYGDKEVSDETKYANLRLIAAAPDLLEALKSVTHALRMHAPTPYFDRILKAEAVIAKAES